MQARLVEAAPGRVHLGDGRELVLVRYPRTRGGGGGTPDIEGFVRTIRRRVGVLARAPRYARPAMSELSHVDASGAARMVNVGDKAVTNRVAVAAGSIAMMPSTLAAIRENQVAKGDVLAVARIAGIQAAKRTAELIPLCHQIALTEVAVEFTADDTLPGYRVRTTARSSDRTGVEMEAIIAASVSLITIYDMAKGVDKGMVIGEISLVEKRGGKDGDWVRNP